MVKTIKLFYDGLIIIPLKLNNMKNIIEQKITTALAPSHLEVINETHMHNVPADADSHFKVIVVANEFEGKGLVQRHRLINQILAEQLAGQIHALALHTLTPEEWQQKSEKSFTSPPCEGGSK